MRRDQVISRRWPLLFLAVLSAVAGLGATLAFAPYGWWPLAILAVATLTWATRHTSGLVAATLVGWCFGLAFMGTSLHWQTNIMTLSYVGLTVATSVLYAVIGGLTKVVAHVPGAPLWTAAVWSLGEWVLSLWPFEGFMWMRLGYTGIDSPLAGLYPFVGAAGVTFVIALMGALVTWLVESPSWRRVIGAGSVTLSVLVAGWIGTGWSPTDASSETINVGWVQGGAPGGGVFGLGPARTITTNQAKETAALVDQVGAGDVSKPAFIVWPENSTDLDPRLDPQTQALVEGAVKAAGVPILVGSVYEGPGEDERQTVSIWWTDQGPTQVYAKQNLVPFGEWIPGRDWLLPLIPELRYVGSQSVPGTEPGVLDVEVDGAPLGVGVAICYEVIYPETLYASADAGADLMTVMSSNAMYQGTNQIDQQFAITRVRAAEMRRDILVVTTSGVSGRIGSHGEVMWTAPDHVAASGVETMPLARPVTPVMQWGGALEIGLALLGGFGVIAGSIRRVATQRSGTMDATSAAVADE